MTRANLKCAEVLVDVPSAARGIVPDDVDVAIPVVIGGTARARDLGPFLPDWSFVMLGNLK